MERSSETGRCVCVALFDTRRRTGMTSHLGVSRLRQLPMLDYWRSWELGWVSQGILFSSQYYSENK